MRPDPAALGLSVRGLSWGPAPDRPIIRDISFDVAPGSTTVIVGANGAGKSSLLRCFYRQNRPLSGHVLIGDQDVWRTPRRDLARRVAAVLQENAPDFNFTTREVVAMGRIPHRPRAFSWDPADEARIDRMLAGFELTDFGPRPFSQLSGGEKQRALLARALLQDPRLIILDEPTNHLDVRHQLEVIEAMRHMDITVIVTLHDLNLAASLADQVVVLHQGRVLAIGPPDAAMTPETLRHAFGVMTDIDRHPRLGTPRLTFSLPH